MLVAVWIYSLAVRKPKQLTLRQLSRHVSSQNVCPDFPGNDLLS